MARKRKQTNTLSSDPATAYAQAVVAGEIVAGRPVVAACRRHLDDLEHGPARGLVWRPEKAERVYRFFRAALILPEVEKPFELEPWQKFIVGSLFGWHRSDGTRRFRVAFVETAKGSGKSPLAAGIGLYGLAADDEHAPEIYSAAVTREQAGIMFSDAQRMRDLSPVLSRLVEKGVKHLTIPSRFGTFRPLSSEHRGLDGKRPHIALIDEIHEHPTPLVVDKLRAGTKGRRNALIFEITNSGFDRNSVCWDHHSYSIKVAEGAIENDSWFGYVCSVDDDDPFENESSWLKANPNLGVSIQPRYIREQVEEARGMPSKENIVRRLNFCQWTEQATRWLPMMKWDQCVGEYGPLELRERMRGRRCFGGLDLSSTADTSALALYFPPEDFDSGELPVALLWTWIPGEQVAEKMRRDRVPFDVWIRGGFVEATPGEVVDYKAIRRKINELSELYSIVEIGFDRWNATGLVTDLAEEDGANMVPIGQGFVGMSAPSKELERLVACRGFVHGGDPVFRWFASNATVKIDPAGNIKPDKSSSIQRIDGIVALVMALSRASVTREAGPSVYEERGILAI